MTHYYAHSLNACGERQELVDHLHRVAELSACFATPFADPGLARLIGLAHDIGKFSDAFQTYLVAAESGRTASRTDHKAAGAALVARSLGPLAMLVQGHHGGLRGPAEFGAWLSANETQTTEAALKRAMAALPELDAPTAPPLPAWVQHQPLEAEMFMRFLFSALVDADFLDTEHHFAPERATSRLSPISLEELWRRFQEHRSRFPSEPAGVVGWVRQETYRACLEAAASPVGLFRLTVPTGGGKTLSGMAFALRHALHHGLKRVIVAVPLVSITEQTTAVYRGVFERPGEAPVVLEHHSGVRESGEEEDLWRRLAAENWDASIVVTTTVQLFESLFANGPAKTRKLHNLAESVIIVDEAQALPAHLLAPTLDALQQLCRHYRTSVVLSTATQPAFEAVPGFSDLPAREIVPEPERLFEPLRRVEYQWRTEGETPWAEVAGWMHKTPQALAVLNTKGDALTLLEELDDPTALHLSTLLCGQHRQQVIKEVAGRLARGEPCRLVSTQVVEAGVDLDFPLVLRALGPLDSIIQAAGRCNREGKLDRGEVIVFRPQGDGMPPGTYRTAAGVTGALLGAGDLDPSDTQTVRRYFRRLFQSISTDRKQIQRLRCRLEFSEVAAGFRMIESDTMTVAVAYGGPEERNQVRRSLEQLRRGTPQGRLFMRQLQPYLVSLYRYQAERYERAGLIAPVLPGLGEWQGQYDGTRGLVAQDLRADDLVV